MGLDMYAYRTSVNFSKPVDFQDEIYMLNESGENTHTQIAYWRNYSNLHKWMEGLYYKKGGLKESFNCVPVELTLEDLDLLEKDVNEKALPNTKGILFEELDNEGTKRHLTFIKNAKEAILAGDRVFYDSWW